MRACNQSFPCGALNSPFKGPTTCLCVLVCAGFFNRTVVGFSVALQGPRHAKPGQRLCCNGFGAGVALRVAPCAWLAPGVDLHVRVSGGGRFPPRAGTRIGG